MSDLPSGPIFDADERVRRAYLAGLQPAERDVNLIRVALRVSMRALPEDARAGCSEGAAALLKSLPPDTTHQPSAQAA